MNFHAKLIEYMQTGITIEQISKAIGASIPTVTWWIKGIREPHPAMWNVLFDQLDKLKWSTNKDEENDDAS